jgi:DNA-binding response OmpR family regulator
MTQTMADSILIVDDTPIVCALIAHTLSELPYRVITTDSVRSAKELLGREIERIRVLLVDCGLPDGSGFDIVAEARRLKPRVPILLMSGYAIGDAGGVDFILKPFDPVELLDRVEAMAR